MLNWKNSLWCIFFLSLGPVAYLESSMTHRNLNLNKEPARFAHAPDVTWDVAALILRGIVFAFPPPFHRLLLHSNNSCDIKNTDFCLPNDGYDLNVDWKNLQLLLEVKDDAIVDFSLSFFFWHLLLQSLSFAGCNAMPLTCLSVENCYGNWFFKRSLNGYNVAVRCLVFGYHHHVWLSRLALLANTAAGSDEISFFTQIISGIL